VLIMGLLVWEVSLAGVAGMRGPLFGPVDKVREHAEASKAPTLAPTSYAKGLDYYERAESTLAKGGSIDWIRRHLEKAQGYFAESVEAAQLASAMLDAVIEARKDAMASDAAQFAEDSWRDGETNFMKSTQRLESGSIKYAQSYASKAEQAYRAAELTAIKANYLNETKTLLVQAEKLRAKKYAPRSLERAQLLLSTAEQELTTNRYDTDRPRLLALEAKHNALHAIYVAKLDQRIRSRATSLEETLLAWEASINKIGDQLDVPLYYDHGEAAAVDSIVTRISALQAERDRTAQELADSQTELAALNAQVAQTQTMMAEISALQKEKEMMDENLGDQQAQVVLLNERLAKMQNLLGGGNQTIEELERMLELQAEHRQRFATVENIFPAEEAAVFRQGDTVIIRMIGLNFDSGKAQLKPEHTNMLATLQQAINAFPDSSVLVEGHTDAFGSDAQNQVLSQSRAESVLVHLRQSMPNEQFSFNSVGYGESRPVANNETEEGRKRNRRIDVVIKPNWVLDTSASPTQVAAAESVGSM
jgi:outer membrane protein OmpA-like peptidoglycan-associated protein